MLCGCFNNVCVFTGPCCHDAQIDKDGGGSLDPKELKEALFEVNADSEETKEILDARSEQRMR